jgi:hypothetical protein
MGMEKKSERILLLAFIFIWGFETIRIVKEDIDHGPPILHAILFNSFFIIILLLLITVWVWSGYEDAPKKN